MRVTYQEEIAEIVKGVPRIPTSSHPSMEIRNLGKFFIYCYNCIMNLQLVFSKAWADFKQMPLILKVLLILGTYSMTGNILDMIALKPVAFSYFGTGFPKNLPLVWYGFNFLLNFATIAVWFKRSYTWLKTYTFVSLGLIVLAVLNSIYMLNSLPENQRMITIGMYFVTYLIGVVILVYVFRQKQYFNNP